MIHISLICDGRAIPFVWDVIEHKSASVAFEVYQPLLRKVSWLLRHHPDVMLLADRGFANQSLLKWLRHRAWHFAIRVPSDTLVHGIHRWRATPVSELKKVTGEAKLYHKLRLWEEGIEQVNLVLACPKGTTEPWAMVTGVAE